MKSGGVEPFLVQAPAFRMNNSASAEASLVGTSLRDQDEDMLATLDPAWRARFVPLVRLLRTLFMPIAATAAGSESARQLPETERRRRFFINVCLTMMMVVSLVSAASLWLTGGSLLAHPKRVLAVILIAMLNVAFRTVDHYFVALRVTYVITLLADLAIVRYEFVPQGYLMSVGVTAMSNIILVCVSSVLVFSFREAALWQIAVCVWGLCVPFVAIGVQPEALELLAQIAVPGVTAVGGSLALLYQKRILVKYNAEMAATHERAQALSRAKARFIAAMSHEVRTPLNGLMGLADALAETQPLQESQRELVEGIQSCARVVLALSTRALQYTRYTRALVGSGTPPGDGGVGGSAAALSAGRLGSRTASQASLGALGGAAVGSGRLYFAGAAAATTAGGVSGEPRAFSLRKVLDDAAVAMSASAAPRRVAVHCSAAPDVVDTLWGHADLLLELVMKMLSFSLSRVPDLTGRVLLRAEAAPAAVDSGAPAGALLGLRLVVRDNGPPLPAEQVALGIQPLMQSDSSPRDEILAAGADFELATASIVAEWLHGTLMFCTDPDSEAGPLLPVVVAYVHMPRPPDRRPATDSAVAGGSASPGAALSMQPLPSPRLPPRPSRDGNARRSSTWSALTTALRVAAHELFDGPEAQARSPVARRLSTASAGSTLSPLGDGWAPEATARRPVSALAATAEACRSAAGMPAAMMDAMPASADAAAVTAQPFGWSSPADMSADKDLTPSPTVARTLAAQAAAVGAADAGGDASATAAEGDVAAVAAAAGAPVIKPLAEWNAALAGPVDVREVEQRLRKLALSQGDAAESSVQPPTSPHDHLLTAAAAAAAAHGPGVTLTTPPARRKMSVASLRSTDSGASPSSLSSRSASPVGPQLGGPLRRSGRRSAAVGASAPSNAAQIVAGAAVVVADAAAGAGKGEPVGLPPSVGSAGSMLAGGERGSGENRTVSAAAALKLAVRTTSTGRLPPLSPDRSAVVSRPVSGPARLWLLCDHSDAVTALRDALLPAKMRIKHEYVLPGPSKLDRLVRGILSSACGLRRPRIALLYMQPELLLHALPGLVRAAVEADAKLAVVLLVPPAWVSMLERDLSRRMAEEGPVRAAGLCVPAAAPLPARTLVHLVRHLWTRLLDLGAATPNPAVAPHPTSAPCVPPPASPQRSPQGASSVPGGPAPADSAPSPASPVSCGTAQTSPGLLPLEAPPPPPPPPAVPPTLLVPPSPRTRSPAPAARATGSAERDTGAEESIRPLLRPVASLPVLPQTPSAVIGRSRAESSEDGSRVDSPSPSPSPSTSTSSAAPVPPPAEPLRQSDPLLASSAPPAPPPPCPLPAVAVSSVPRPGPRDGAVAGACTVPPQLVVEVVAPERPAAAAAATACAAGAAFDSAGDGRAGAGPSLTVARPPPARHRQSSEPPPSSSSLHGRPVPPSPREALSDLDSAVPVARTEPLISGRVLMVDDNRLNLAVLRRQLRKLGIDADSCENGAACLQRLEQSVQTGSDGAAGPAYVLVLMDLHMPGMDGLEATRRLRQLERERGWARTPVVAVTASVAEESEAACRAAGMDGFLSKPIALVELEQAIRRAAGVQAGAH